jgi:hypothetical protein
MSADGSNEPSTTPKSKDSGSVDYEPKGTVDLVSYLYVLCGIPAMILFFLVLFGLTGALDAQSIYIPA